MMKKIKKTINIFLKKIFIKKEQRKTVFFVVFFVVFLGIFFIADNVYAVPFVPNLGKMIPNALSWIIHGLVWILGRVLLVLIFILKPIASYSDFVKSPPVREAWGIVRDLCNMFFILILLIIAFATILRVESYSVKKALPKLLIMAILINFSKSICGVFIDLAQVIMLTFVNSFQSLGDGNLTKMLGIDKLLEFNFEKQDTDAFNKKNEVSAVSILGVHVLALIYILISIVVMAVIIGVLIMRIVMLWIYIILSPFAYLLAAFPQGQKYASQWWGEFTKALVVGPMLAFFIWLSFASLGDKEPGEILSINGNPQVFDSQYVPQAGPSQAGSANHMIKFCISIGMLLGGLIVTQQVGGVFGTIASKTVAGMQKGGKFVAGGAVDWVNRKQMGGIPLWKNKDGKRVRLGTGIDFNVGRAKERIKTGWEEGKRKDLQKGAQLANRNLGQGGLVGLATGMSAEGYMDSLRGGRAVGQTLGALFQGKGFFKGRITTKGITKDTVKEKDNNKKYHDNVISEDEYNTKRKEVDVNLAKETTNKTTLEADLVAKNAEVAKASGKDKEKLQSEVNKIKNNIFESDSNTKSLKDNRLKLDKMKSGIGPDGKDFVDDKGRLLFVKDQKEADKRRAGYKEKVDEATQKITFYQDTNLDVVMQEKSARAEEKNKIGDIKDEEHIISLMDAAESQDDFVRWGALSEKLAEINGTNNLMARNGYHVDTSGFDDEELEVLQGRMKKGGKEKEEAEKEYDEGKGWNDYMRDMGEKFGAQRQSVLRLQTDLGSMGELKRALHLQKTVGVDSSGQLKLNDRETRVKVQITENNKKNIENSLRSDNRLEYGGEGRDGKDYKFDESGLAFITEHIDKVATLMDGQRMNPSSVAAFAEETAQRQLKKALEYMGKTEIQGKTKTYTIDDMLKRFKDESRGKSDRNFKAIVGIARDER